MIDYQCETCGNTFARHKRGPARRFCSWECRDIRRYGEKLEVPCPQCQKPFKKRRENQKWCSIQCQRAARAKRYTARPRGWYLKAKGEDACRNCGRPPSHLHHIVPRSKCREAREDVHTNGLPLCATCHRGWHDRTVTIYHDRLTDDEFFAAHRRAGVIWMERNYPEREEYAMLRHSELAGHKDRWHDRPEVFDERVDRLMLAAEARYYEEAVACEPSRGLTS